MIDESIVARLTDDTKAPMVTRLIENDNGTFRIYPGEIEPGQPTPNIAYECDNSDPVEYMGGVLGLVRSRMVLNIWGTTTDEAKELREEVRLNVSGLSRQYVGPHFINKIGLRDGGDIRYVSEGNKPMTRKGVQLELDIWHQEQVPAPG